MPQTCPQCGTSNRDTARFCNNCAAPLASEIVCPACRTPNPPAARFCLNCAAPLRGATPQTGMLPPNTVLSGRYIVLRKVGGGGMGAVYQTTDQRITGKLWAVKEMSDAALTTPLDKQQAVDAFRREAQLLATLDHGNLPKVSDFFTEGGKHYLVMDFIQGQTLEQALGQTPGFLPESQVTDWAMQLCDVLAYLHSRQQPIIFRDLKPTNIMHDADGRIKLIDFGIARAFQPGKSKDTQAMGTPGYAAPEQYGVGQSDARSDVYALGVTLHRLLTRYDPALSPFSLPPPRNINAALSPAVAAVIAQATQADMTTRFQTMAEMKQALVSRQAPAQAPVAPSPLAPAAASAGAVRPYVLAPGLVANTPEELAQVCERDWDRAVSHFCSGYFETWLRGMHQHGLADDAQKIVGRVKSGDQNECSLGLAEWLVSIGYSFMVPPILHVHPASLDCGQLGPSQTWKGTVTITNNGQGVLEGVVLSNAAWLSGGQKFRCAHRQQERVEVIINSGSLAPGQTYQAELIVTSNGGMQRIPIKVNIGLPPKLSMSTAELQLGYLSRSGSVHIQNAGGGKLEGRIQANGDVIVQPTGYFQSNALEVVVGEGPGARMGGIIGYVIIQSNGGNQKIAIRK